MYQISFKNIQCLKACDDNTGQSTNLLPYLQKLQKYKIATNTKIVRSTPNVHTERQLE